MRNFHTNTLSRRREFDTEHVIKLIGVVSNHMPYWVLLEYMALGDLKSYLRTRRPGSEYNLDNKPAPSPKVRECHRTSSRIETQPFVLSCRR